MVGIEGCEWVVEEEDILWDRGLWMVDGGWLEGGECDQV